MVIVSRIINLLFKSSEPTTLILDRWTFVSFFADAIQGQQFGLKYFIETGPTPVNSIYQTRPALPYQLSPAGAILWGGRDGYYASCGCVLQYVRLYWDYLADSEDKMINLAVMNSESIFLAENFFE